MLVRLGAFVLALVAMVGVAGPVAADDPTYMQRAFEVQVVPWGDLIYNEGTKVSPPAPDGAVDADGIPLRNWNGALYYTADNIARQGLYRLKGFARTGDAAYTQVLDRFDTKLRSMAQPVGDAWFFPWPFSYGNEHLTTPWYNAMTEGLVLSFFSRMYEIYGDPSDLDAAAHVFASYLIMGPISTPWVATVERGYLWLEHYPGGVTHHVLNAHLWATLGIYDYWRQLQRDGSSDIDAVQTVLDGAITTVRSNVWRYRRAGHTSLYALVHRTSYLSYHLLHIRQLRLLAKISADSYFATAADLFYADAN
jgi:hypothetical protein